MDRAGRARNARINQALQHSLEMRDALSRLAGHPMTAHVDLKGEWQDARNALERLTQCFHEANAYNNLHTDASDSSQGDRT